MGNNLDLLLKVFRETRSFASEEEVAKKIINILQREKGYRHIVIAMVKEDKILPLCSTGLFEGIDSLGVKEGIVGWVIRNKKARIVKDVREDPCYFEVSPFIRSEITVPIMDKSSVIGVIDVESEELSAFDCNDKTALNLLAEFLYVAFERIRLLNSWKLRAKERELVLTIVKGVASKRSLEEFAIGLAREIRSNKGFFSVGVLKVDEGKLDLIHWEGAIKKGYSYMSYFPMDIHTRSVVTRAVKTGRLQNVPDVDKDRDYMGIIDGVVSELAVPIKVRDRVIGVIVVQSDRLSAFTEDDEEFLSLLADITANIMYGIGEYERAEAIRKKLNNSYKEMEALNAELGNYIDKLSFANEKLELAKEELREAYVHTIRALIKAIERKDPYTRGHSDRVAELSVEIGKMLVLNEEEQKFLRYAGLLHDIGKIVIDEEILNKPGKLTYEEYEEVKKHAVYGSEIVGEIGYLKDVAIAIRHHHERWDGKGYPDGLQGEGIPLFSRIMTVADSYDAMISMRSYRDALSIEDTIKELEAGKGRQFDPYIVDLFMMLIRRRSGL